MESADFEGSVTFQSVVQSAAQTLCHTYSSHIHKYKDEIARLKEENDNLFKTNEKLKIELSFVKEKCDSEHSDFIRLHRELAETTKRLTAPCGNCLSLLQQIEQQQSLFKTLLEQKDTSLAHVLERYLGEKKATEASACHLLSELSQAVSLEQPASPRPHALPHTGKETRKKDETSPNTIGCAKLKLTRNTKRNRYTVVEESARESKRIRFSDSTTTKPQPITSTDRSPKTSPPTSVLETKRKVKAQKSPYKLIKEKDDVQSELKTPPRFHVPETCAYSPDKSSRNASTLQSLDSSSDNSRVDINNPQNKMVKLVTGKPGQIENDPKIDTHLLTKAQKERMKRPPIVIPETVPMDYESDENENNHIELNNHSCGDPQSGRHNHSDSESDAEVIAASDDENIRAKNKVRAKLFNRTDVKQKLKNEKPYKIISYKYNPMNSKSKGIETVRQTVPLRELDRNAALTPISVSSESVQHSDNENETKSGQNETVKGILENPPSHTSTPINFGPEQYSVNIETPDHIDVSSPPDSPVFEQNQGKPHVVKRQGKSPVVKKWQNESGARFCRTFSEDESSLLISNEPECNNHKASPAKENRKSMLFGSQGTRKEQSFSHQEKESPSVLSGKAHTSNSCKVSKQSPKSRQFVPLEMLSDGESPNILKTHKAKPSSQRTKSSPKKSNQRERKANEGSPWKLSKKPARSSQVSPAKSRLRKSQSTLSPGKLVMTRSGNNESPKRFLQTKLSADAFRSKKPSLKQRAQIYNGAQDDDAYTQQEIAWLEQAKQASLREIRSPDPDRDSASHGRDLDSASCDPDLDSMPRDMLLTEPCFTSTPAVPRNTRKDGSVKHAAFRKPQSVRELPRSASPQSPVHSQPISSQHSLRRSPRFKLARDTGKEEETGVGSRSGELEPSEYPERRAYNDTVDPEVRLSQYDRTYAAVDIADVTEGQKVVSFSDVERAQRAKDTQEYLRSLENHGRRLTRSRLHPNTQGSSHDSENSKLSGSQASSKSSESQQVLKARSRSKDQVAAKPEGQGEIKKQNPSLEIVDEEDYSVRSAVFDHQPRETGAHAGEQVTRGHIATRDGRQAPGTSGNRQQLDDSFDRIPGKGADAAVDYKYVEVVRKQAERRRLDAYACKECEEYYDGMGLTEEEKRKRMESCRHRALFVPPDTPEHFWEIEFPDTQECRQRGYLNVTQAKPSKSRRRRPLRKLSKPSAEGGDRQQGDASD